MTLRKGEEIVVEYFGRTIGQTLRSVIAHAIERAQREALFAAAEIADVQADEKDVLALSADESNFAAYREGERAAKDIADAIRNLLPSGKGD